MDSAALRAEMENLIAKGAENIDLVTPTQFLPTVLPALEKPLPVPVVYNCGGYESVETIRALAGKIDIYLPDLKYADNVLAKALSGISFGKWCDKPDRFNGKMTRSYGVSLSAI